MPLSSDCGPLYSFSTKRTRWPCRSAIYLTISFWKIEHATKLCEPVLCIKHHFHPEASPWASKCRGCCGSVFVPSTSPSALSFLFLLRGCSGFFLVSGSSFLAGGFSSITFPFPSFHRTTSSAWAHPSTISNSFIAEVAFLIANSWMV